MKYVYPLSTNSYRPTVLFPSFAAPCPPSQLSASVNCGSNSAALTWNSSPNAASYTGKAVSTDGHNVTCDAGAELSCQLEGLHCGKEYAFTVSASDGDCRSPDSTPVIHTTGEREWHLCFLSIYSYSLPKHFLSNPCLHLPFVSNFYS